MKHLRNQNTKQCFCSKVTVIVELALRGYVGIIPHCHLCSCIQLVLKEKKIHSAKIIHDLVENNVVTKGKIRMIKGQHNRNIEAVLTWIISLGFVAKFFALSIHVPSRKLSSEASNSSISLMSWRNFWLWILKAFASFCRKAITASVYTWFANFDNTCLVMSTKSYLSSNIDLVSLRWLTKQIVEHFV